jgi:hypothetical protein
MTEGRPCSYLHASRQEKKEVNSLNDQDRSGWGREIPRAYPAWLTQLLHVLSDHPRLFLATAQILLPITSLVFLVASARVKDVLGWGAQIPPDRSMLQLAHDLESSRREKLLSCESHRGHHLLGTEHYRCHLPSQCYPTTRQASIAHTLKV